MFNPIQDRVGPPTSFSSVTSAKIGISPQNFLTFSSNTFPQCCKIYYQVFKFKFISSASPKLLNLNQDHLSKKRFFWSNPYKIVVIITSLSEMLELQNFGHMTTFTLQFELRDKFCWWRYGRYDVMTS